MTASDRAVALARLAARAADDKQAQDPLALDVSERMPLSDVFLLVSGRNERMVLAIAEEIEDRLREEAGQRALRREGLEQGRWVLLDFGDLLVHVFHDEERLYYGLERIWRDAPEIVLEPAGGTAERADEQR